MDFLEFCSNYRTMCDKYTSVGKTGMRTCLKGCPMKELTYTKEFREKYGKYNRRDYCAIAMFDMPEKALEVLENWQNNRMTRAKVFMKAMPTAKVGVDGVPLTCAALVFGFERKPDCKTSVGCTNCWNEYVEE